jgi:hypothetical protein
MARLKNINNRVRLGFNLIASCDKKAVQHLILSPEQKVRLWEFALGIKAVVNRIDLASVYSVSCRADPRQRS